jgi:hypothetical protein
MQTLHSIRDQLVGDRTSLMNQIRSLLLERGHLVPQGRAKLAVRLGEILDGDEPVLGFRIHRLVTDMRLRWKALDERIADLDAEFTETARTDERTRRLLTIPGIGSLTLGGPAGIAIIECLRWTIDRRCVLPSTTRLKHMHDATDHPPVVNARHAARLVRQQRWLGLFEQHRAIYKWNGCRLIMPLREAAG